MSEFYEHFGRKVHKPGDLTWAKGCKFNKGVIKIKL